MNQEMVIRIAEQGIYTVLMVSGPLILLALVVGLIISILQATTQIQEQTLAFVPKIVGVSPWNRYLWAMDDQPYAFLCK